MTWKYIASKHTQTFEAGESQEVWEVREFYEKSGKMPQGWTERPVKAYGNSREELIHDLEMMLEDVKRGDYLDLDEEKVKESE